MWLTYLSWLRWKRLVFPLWEGFNWNSLVERGGTLCLLLLHAQIVSGLYFCRSCLGCHSLCEFVCAQALLLMEDTILGVICHLRSLSSFSFFFYIDSWSLRGGCDKDISLRGEYSKVSHSLYIVILWVSVLITIGCKKKFPWWRLSEVMIYVYNNILLWFILLLCFFILQE